MKREKSVFVCVCVCGCVNGFSIIKRDTTINGNKNRDERMKAALLVISAVFSISYFCLFLFCFTIQVKEEKK